MSLGSLGGVAAYTAYVYEALPERVATHFDLHGNPNGWMDRPMATWGMQGLGLFFWFVIRSSSRWLPVSGGWRERLQKSPLAGVAMLTAFLLASINVFVVATAQHPGESHAGLLTGLVGAFCLALSVLLPRVRRNPLIGVRTSFTLSSDENWARTHRVASYAFAASGLMGLASAAAGLPALRLCACLGGGLAPLLYSWVVQYRLPPGA
jgi:uncharacterized membrane protein